MTPRYALNISLTEEESQLVDKLKDKNIKPKDIFRRGLYELAKDNELLDIPE